MSTPRALVATDLDGTLVDRNDRVSTRDKEAILEAREAGIVVTIATGRLTTRTLHLADELGIDVPVICADGGVLVSPPTRDLVDVRVLGDGLLGTLLSSCEEEGLASFVFDHGRIVGCTRGERHHAYVRGWSHTIEVDANLHASADRLASSTVMFVAIGDDVQVESLTASLSARAHEIDVLRYRVGDHQAVRYVGAGVDKGTALHTLADTLGVPMVHTACVGDWLNDLPMFDTAGFACAMPHAPDEVKARADHVLDAHDAELGPLTATLRAFRERGTRRR